MEYQTNFNLYIDAGQKWILLKLQGIGVAQTTFHNN
jgi:hypothetical protein